MPTVPIYAIRNRSDLDLIIEGASAAPLITMHLDHHLILGRPPRRTTVRLQQSQAITLCHILTSMYHSSTLHGNSPRLASLPVSITRNGISHYLIHLRDAGTHGINLTRPELAEMTARIWHHLVSHPYGLFAV